MPTRKPTKAKSKTTNSRVAPKSTSPFKSFSFSKRQALILAFVFVIIAFVIIRLSLAGGSPWEPESWTQNPSGSGKVVQDQSASTGSYLQMSSLTTPTPTPVIPSVTPTPTPVPGGFVIRDGNNTGVPAGTSLTSCPGNRNITVANTVIENCTINGDIGILADNVTIRKSKFNGGVVIGRGYQGGSDKNVNKTIIEDSEFTGGGDTTGISGVNDVDGIYRRNNMHGWQNCMTMWTSTRAQILDSFCHDEQSNTSAQHYDGIEVYGVVGGIIVRGNTVYQTQSNGATAPLNITTESNITGTVVVEDNLLRSANSAYVILVAARSSNQSITLVANRNRLWPANSGGGLFGYWGGSQGRITGSGSGNVNHLTGAAVSVPASN